MGGGGCNWWEPRLAKPDSCPTDGDHLRPALLEVAFTTMSGNVAENGRSGLARAAASLRPVGPDQIRKIDPPDALGQIRPVRLSA